MKKIFIALALCLVMVSLIATPAFAMTTKVPLFKLIDYINSPGNDEPVYEPSETTPPYAIYGYATFIVDQGDNKVTVNLTIKGADKNAKYYVFLYYQVTTPNAEVVFSKLGKLTTNKLGNWGGQNSQTEFQKTIPPGEYVAFIVLQREEQATWLPAFPSLTSWESPVTFRISN